METSPPAVDRRKWRWQKSLLDRLAVPYYVARGNHDRLLTGRVGTGADEGGAQAGAYAVDHFGEAFGRRGDGAPMNYAFSFGGVDFIVLDLSDPRTGIGRLTGETEEWLEARLAGGEAGGQKGLHFCPPQRLDAVGRVRAAGRDTFPVGKGRGPADAGSGAA